MTCRHMTAIRVLSTSIAALLALAVFLMHGSFLPDFLVGMSLGLCIGLLTLVWSKNALIDDRDDKGRPVALNIVR
jgi:preprotein translocase subunit SecF